MRRVSTVQLGTKTVVGLVALAATTSAHAQVTFTDVAEAAGLEFTTEYGPAFDYVGNPAAPIAMLQLVQRNMGNGAAVADYDNDGDFDIYLLGGLGKSNRLYRNELEAGTLAFVEVTAEAGLVNLGLSRVAQFTDLDNDGWQDLILLNDSHATWQPPLVGLNTKAGNTASSATVEVPSSIYRNNGDGTFTDVTIDSGFNPLGYIKGGLGVVDYDQDGLLDIMVCNWGALQAAGFTWLPGHNRLYRNLGDFQFLDVTEDSGLGLVASNSFTPLFADVDNDGDPDLYVAVDGYPDLFYVNVGGVFHEISEVVGLVHVGTDMGATAFDFDHDGDLDIFSTNVTHPENVWGGNMLAVNKLVETGTLQFVDEAFDRGVSNTGWGWGTDWIDCNNGGFHELFAVNGFDEFVALTQPPDVADGLIDLRSFLFADFTSGTYSEIPQTGADVVGDSRAAIAFDADRDGRQDLLITQMNAPVTLLRCDTTPSGHWLAVKLVGGGPVSLDAVGARVYVTVGGQTTLMQELIGGGSYMSGRPYELHFGLGPFTIVDELRVEWPGGYVNTAYNLTVDRVFTGVLTITGASNDGGADGEPMWGDHAVDGKPLPPPDDQSYGELAP